MQFLASFLSVPGFCPLELVAGRPSVSASSVVLAAAATSVSLMLKLQGQSHVVSAVMTVTHTVHTWF